MLREIASDMGSAQMYEPRILSSPRLSAPTWSRVLKVTQRQTQYSPRGCEGAYPSVALWGDGATRGCYRELFGRRPRCSERARSMTKSPRRLRPQEPI